MIHYSTTHKPDLAPQLPPDIYLSENYEGRACAWLDEYVKFSRKWSPLSFDGYHEACGLFLLSTIAARRVVYHLGGPHATNLYIAMIGRTSIHAKSTAAEIAISLLNTTGLQSLRVADETTPQKLIADMATRELPTNFNQMGEEMQQGAILRALTAGQRGWFVDEFGGHIAAMVRPDNVMFGLKGLIRSLDNAPGSYIYSTVTRGENRIVNPYLAMLACLTIIDILPYAKKGAALWGDGFLARFATVTPPSEEIKYGRFPPGERTFPVELTKPLVDWHQRLGLPTYRIEEVDGVQALRITSQPQTTIEISKNVNEQFYRYTDTLRRMTAEHPESQDLDGNYARFPEKALRMAALFTSLDNQESIEMRHWAKAQAIAERWREGLHQLHQQVNETQQDTEKLKVKNMPIEDQILRALKSRSHMTRRDLCQFTGCRVDVIEPAISKLLLSQQIDWVNTLAGITYKLHE